MKTAIFDIKKIKFKDLEGNNITVIEDKELRSLANLIYVHATSVSIELDRFSKELYDSGKATIDNPEVLDQVLQVLEERQAYNARVRFIIKEYIETLKQQLDNTKDA